MIAVATEPTPLERALQAARTQPTISTAEARLILGVSEDTVLRALHQGELEHVRLGRNFRVLSGPLLRKVGME